MTPEEILQQAEEQKRQTSSATQTGTKPEQPLTPSFSSEADIDARLTEMLMADAKADKEREEKRLQRQAAARSLTDLGGAFIDMIKASEGATVSPRSLEQHYNRLDDRQKQVYDAYRARVDLLRRQKAYRDRVRAAEARRAAEVEARLKTQKEIAAMQEEGRDRRAKEAADSKIKAERIKADARVRTRTTPAGEQEMIVPFAGQDYPIKKKIYDGRMAQLYAYMDQNNLFPEASQANDDLKSIMYLMGSTDSSKAPESSKGKLITAVNVALNYIKADSKHAANIIAILQGTYSNAAASQKPETGHAAQGQGQKKKVNW